MENIRFNYLYRDAGNYKQRGSVVFANPDGLTIDLIAQALQNAFLQDGLFIAHQIRVPEVFFSAEGDATSDDHCFHEFESAEFTPEGPNDVHARSIGNFVAEVEKEGERCWTAFDPHDVLAKRILE